jgi:hypothetical protein
MRYIAPCMRCERCGHAWGCRTVSENFITETFSIAPEEGPDVPWKRIRPHDTGERDEIVRQVLQRSIQDQIRDRAYELYVQRGRHEGCALQDWLDAELEMLANR